MISIIMLVYNAKVFTKHAIKTISKSKTDEDIELIIVDNNSNAQTKKMLLKLQRKAYIDKLLLLKENIYFAKGNNVESQLCDKNSDKIILINSDVEIRNAKWLDIMLRYHKKGATCLGVCENNPYTRGDGYCFLINKECFYKYGLDEKFEWWWSVTKLEAQLLRDGYDVTAIRNHENILHHFGGMSGKAWKKSKGLEIEGNEIISWFKNKNINIIENVPIDPKYNINYKNLYIQSILKLKNIKMKIKNIIKNMIERVRRK